MVSSVILAFVSNKWLNTSSWPFLPVSFISHCAIRRFHFTAVPPMIKLKNEKKKKEKPSTPVDNMRFTCDIILANTLVQTFQDDWCQTVFILSKKNALVAFCGVVTILSGLRMSVHLGSWFNFKNNGKTGRAALEPLAPVGQTPATFAPGCQGLRNLKQGIKICLFSGYCVSFNRPGNSSC